MTRSGTTAEVRSWLASPLPPDVARSIDRLATAEDVAYVAVMPDVHLAEEVCVGIAVATRRLVYPSAVGGDIGCGMAAIRFDATADLLADERSAARLLAGLYQSVPGRRHGRETRPKSFPDDLNSLALSSSLLESLKRREGLAELGTLGSGNHFLEFQADSESQLWLMVHSGSRAMGQAITAFHRERGSPTSSGMRALDTDSQTGRDYLEDLGWALSYAQANRRAMVEAVVGLMTDLFGVSADPTTWIAGHA